MAVELEGGCFVARLCEGAPDQVEGNVGVWSHVGRSTGAKAITLRAIEVSKGPSPALLTPPCDEVLYVLEGRGTARIDGHPIALEPNVGIHLAAERVLEIDAEARIVLLSSQCPDPCTPLRLTKSVALRGTAPNTARLDDAATEETGDRWYRVMIDSEVTQFVGGIPPGRAPDHFHHYEEVIFILEGRGRMWAGETNTPVESGAFIFLPKKQMHCLENTGPGEMRLVGVFYPSGSPAVRY
jgi:mannose-6-phosphate isomerase-like protein (cupin superfamily)